MAAVPSVNAAEAPLEESEAMLTTYQDFQPQSRLLPTGLRTLFSKWYRISMYLVMVRFTTVRFCSDLVLISMESP